MTTEEPAESAPGAPARPGRWRSGMESKRKILRAARALFAQNGYDRVTVRAIAAEAGVDPSMIHYFFGSKDRLFAAVLRAPDSPREPLAAMLAEGLEGLGARLVRGFLETWDATKSPEPLLAVVRSASTHQPSADMLREFVDREFTRRLADGLEGPDADLRAALIGGQLLGLAVARYGLRLEPVASADRDTLVARFGPLVQSLITGS